MKVNKLEMEEREEVDLEKNPIENLKLSEFRLEEIGEESARELSYLNKSIYLTDKTQIKLLRDCKTGEVNTIFILNKSHFNVFKVEAGQTKINYDFRGKIGIKDQNYDQDQNNFDYHRIEGNGDLLWLDEQKSDLNPNFRALFPAQLLWTDLSKAQPGEEILSESIEQFLLSVNKKTQVSEIITPVSIQSRLSKSQLFYLSRHMNYKDFLERLNDHSEHSQSEEINLNSSFNLKVVRNNTASRRTYSQTIMKLFTEKIYKHLRNRLRSRGRPYHRTVHLNWMPNQFRSGGKNSIFFGQIQQGKRPNLAYCVHLRHEMIIVTLISLRYKLVLKSVVLDRDKMNKKLPGKYQSLAHYYFSNIFFSQSADTVVMILKPLARQPHPGYESLTNHFMGEIKGVFRKEARKIKWTDITDFESYVVDEKFKRILMKQNRKGRIHFRLFDYGSRTKSIKVWEISRDASGLESFELSGSLVKFSRLRGKKVLVFDPKTIFVIDIKNKVVVSKTRYCHTEIERTASNIDFVDDILVLLDRHGYSFEVFQICPDYQLNYIGEFGTGLQADTSREKHMVEFNLLGSKFLQRKKNGNYLVAYLMKDRSSTHQVGQMVPMGRSLHRLNTPFPVYTFRVIEFDVKSRCVVNTYSMNVNQKRTVFRGISYGLISADEVLVLAHFNRSSVFLQGLDRREGPESESVASGYLEIRLRDRGLQSIESVSFRGKYLCVSALDPNLTKYLVLLELTASNSTQNSRLYKASERILNIGNSSILAERAAAGIESIMIAWVRPRIPANNMRMNFFNLGIAFGDPSNHPTMFKFYNKEIDLFREIELDHDLVDNGDFKIDAKVYSSRGSFAVLSGRDSSNLFFVDFGAKVMKSLSEGLRGCEFRWKFAGGGDYVVTFDQTGFGMGGKWKPNRFLMFRLR